jgi:hypothetical protein
VSVLKYVQPGQAAVHDSSGNLYRTVESDRSLNHRHGGAHRPADVNQNYSRNPNIGVA